MAQETAPPEAVLELRIHGVHNTSPASMLGVSPTQVGRVAGDSVTGIYRAKPGVDLPHRTVPPGMAVEAYSWGALTSGVQGAFGWLKRVLWLLLLPFALANLAYWARLSLGETSGTARWGARAVRVSGALLTVFLVLAPCVVAIDMIAWQCFRGASPGCPRLPDQLDFLVGMPAPRRMAFASAFPLLLLLVLWALSRQSLAKFEATPVPDGGSSTADAPILSRDTMWRGRSRTERLQRLHLTVGIATVIAFADFHLLQQHVSAWVLVNLVLASVLALTALALTCVIHPDDLEHRGSEWTDRIPTSTGGVLLVAQLAVLVSHLLSLAVPTYDGMSQGADFVGHNAWFIAVFVFLTALHLAVFVGGRMPTIPAVGVTLVALVLAGLALRRHLQSTFDQATLVRALLIVLLLWGALTLWHYRFSKPRAAVAWRGAGASVMLATAAWVALLFTSGLTIASANYLNGDDSVSDLVSELPAPLPSEEASKSWTAPGEVVVRDAVVVVSAGTVTVTSGTVAVERLTRPLSGTPDQALLGGGIVREGESAEVRLDQDQVLLEDTCLVERDTLVADYEEVVDRADTTVERCSAEDTSFVNVATLAVADAALTIDATRGRVLLEVSDPPQKPLVVPQVLIWTPIMQLAWLVLTGLAIAWCLGRFMFFVRPALEQVDDPWVSERDRAAVVRHRVSAALAHRAEVLLDVVGAVTAPVALALIVVSSTGRAPWQNETLAWTSHLATPAMYLVLAMSAGLVVLGSRLRKDDETRRAVGVLWDLATFWPRAAHPLAPPCYAERVVPELRTRVGWALGTPPDSDGLVIVSGHSQGSLIVTAVISTLEDPQLSRLRVITYGSQVRALYGRVFPRAVGPDVVGYAPTTPTRLSSAFPDVLGQPGADTEAHAPPEGTLLRRLQDGGGEWVNLFRRTDPLGFRVFADVDGDQDRVTAEVPPAGMGDPGPAVMGHSGYQHTPEYVAVVDAWARGRTAPPAASVVRPVPASTTDVELLPEP